MTARDRIVLLIVLAVGAVAGVWMLLISPERKQASSLSSQVAAVQSQLDSARSKVTAGLAARSQFADDYTQLVRLGEALPQDDNVPSLIYQIQSAADAARVGFQNLQLVPGTTTAAATTPAATTPAATTPAATTPAATTPATGSPGAASTLPPGAGTGTAGFPTEQFTFTFTGNFFHLADFFHRLQQFVVAGKDHIWVAGRLLTVNALSLGAGPKGFPQIAASVSATTYMAPASTGLLNGATPSGPAGSTATPAAPASSASAGTAAATITPSLR